MRVHKAHLVKSFRFEAAHRLIDRPESDKQSRIHGHSYRVEVIVSGSIDPQTGWIVDFAEIKNAFQPIFHALDHRYLNDITGLENPTAACVAEWLYHRLKGELLGLEEVVVYETEEYFDRFPLSSSGRSLGSVQK